MRIIIDESADRRTDVEVTDDVALLEGADDEAMAEAGFRDPEYEVSCPNCNSRLAFRTSDPEAVIVGAGPNYTITCPVHGGTFVIDPRKAATATPGLSRLAISNHVGTFAGGFAGVVSGMRAGSALALGAGSAAGFALAGTNITAPASTPRGTYTVNVTETLAGTLGSPRLTSFAITIT